VSRLKLPPLVAVRCAPVKPRILAIDPCWERDCRDRGFSLIAGVDEAGRGCLFGPVVAAAVILPEPHGLRGVDDSKKLDPEAREALYQRITERAVAWAVGIVDAQTIDRINILQASRLAMRRAVEALQPAADCLLADATHVDLPLPQRAIFHGDAVCRSIAAASIVAKVTRDRSMREWERIYPGFGLANHKGYGTPEHLKALAALGPTPDHRFSFRPVRQACKAVPGLEWHLQDEERQLELFATEPVPARG
jgi:ribonuclease HII